MWMHWQALFRSRPSKEAVTTLNCWGSFKWPLEMHGVSEREKWSWLKLCCLFLTRLMVRAQREWTPFHLEQQLSWCANIWRAHKRFSSFIVFRKAKPKSSPVLHPWEMRWQVTPSSCCAGTIKSANFKLSSLQVNACNVSLNHVFYAFVVMATEQHRGKAPSSRYLLFFPVQQWLLPWHWTKYYLSVPSCPYIFNCVDTCILERGTNLANLWCYGSVNVN